MKQSWLGIASLIGIMGLCGWIGLTSLCNITNPPPAAAIIFKDTNKTNPDLVSLQNCEWMEKDKTIVPTDRSRPFSFGFLSKGEYSVLTVDPTKNVKFDDSAAFWGGLEENGNVWSYFPHEVRKIPIPKNARFLRKVQIREPGNPHPGSYKDHTITSKGMIRA